MEGFKTEQEEKISNNSDLIGTVRQGVTTNEAQLRNVKVKMEEKERRTTDSLNEKVSEVEQKIVADVKGINEKIGNNSDLIDTVRQDVTRNEADLRDFKVEMAEQERRTTSSLNEKVSEVKQNIMNNIAVVKEDVATNKADVEWRPEIGNPKV